MSDKDLTEQPQQQPQLTTERLVLRRIRPDDAEIMYRYRTDPDLCCYQGWDPENIETVHEFVAEQMALAPDTPGTWFQFIICLGETGRMIGDCGITFPPDENQQAEIGYTLIPEHHGHGYATEAAGALLDYLFNDLGKHRVIASTDPRNAGSIAVLERLGMRKEAHHIESLWFKGGWVDDLIYAVLGREWR